MNAILNTFAALQIGDKVTVTFDGGKPRTLTVTDRSDRAAGVTSRRAWGDHKDGGVLWLRDGGLTYYKTLGQKPVTVLGLARLAVLPVAA